MPANLTPQYFEAEKRYRQAKSTPEKIQALEDMLAIMPKHKGTDKLHAELRRKISKLSEEALRKPVIGRKGSGYYIRKEGAGQAVLVGLPNAGKSQIASVATNAVLDVGDYPFTTRSPAPVMARFENIQIQLIDLPPITDSDARAWLPGLLKNADILLLVVDLSTDPINQVEILIEELKKMRIKPEGIRTTDEGELTLSLKKTLIIGNKIDLINSTENFNRLDQRYRGELSLLSLSAATGNDVTEMKKYLFQMLDVIRIYTKSPWQKAELTQPVILPKGSTVANIAESIHKDFAAKLKYALIWGSGKYDGQRVKREHVLQDGDIIELHM